jgi:hypothetical protein
MNDAVAPDVSEQIQRMVASLVATQPAGVGLRLVGGFRYRLLDHGARRSVDIDYHWHGDLTAKRDELIALFERRLLPEVRRQLGMDGRAAPARGAGDESAAVATVDLAFWKLGSSLGRIEIPVDILRIECADPPAVRTADGIVYRTASDADMWESKVIAIVARTHVEHRDLVDLHLFANHIAPDAGSRIHHKLSRLEVGASSIRRRLDDLRRSADHHAKTLDAVIGAQIDPPSAATLVDAGGGRAVLASVCMILAKVLDTEGLMP